MALHVQQVEPGNLFRLNVRHYNGPVVKMHDGTMILPGELVGELHLVNRELFRIQQDCSNQVKATMKIKKELKQSLNRLAARVARQEIAQGVKAFYGITVFHQGARLLGFEVKEFRPGFWRFCYWLGQMTLLILYHPAGVKRLRQGHHSLTPKVIWLSQATLIKEFLLPGSSPQH